MNDIRNNIMTTRSKKAIEDSFKIDKYGDYQLTEAIRLGSQEMLHQGYRHMSYTEDQFQIGVSIASVSEECILDIFYEMLDLMSDEVMVVLTSHHSELFDEGSQKEFYSLIDIVVLRSILIDYEELLLNDGFLGISVFMTKECEDGDSAIEVQLDDHKALICYGYSETIDKFDQIYEIYGLVRNDEMKLMAEFQHAHFTSLELLEKFKELKIKLGAE